MLKKISRKTFIAQYPNIIQASLYRNKYIIPETYDSYLLFVEAGSTIGLCNRVSQELSKLIALLGYKNILFLGDTTIPWLVRSHDYPPVARGLAYLKDNGISKSFNGAIRVDNDELPGFMKHLFWLVRCNGIVIYAHFVDPGFNVMGSIDQYGRIHFSTLNEAADVAFNDALIKTNLMISTDNNIGKRRIPHRQATFTGS